MTMNSTESGIVSCPDVRTAGDFMAMYADWLFSSGSTCIRLEKNLKRIASSLGVGMEMFIMPRHIQITVTRDEQIFTSVVAINERPISFDLNTRLSKLSWDMADGHIGFGEARKELHDIIESRSVCSPFAPLLASLANAAFCRLFGGDAVAMAIVFVATYVGLTLKGLMSRRGVDVRITVMVCAFVSSVLAASDMLFSLGTTPEVAIGTSVLYLVPGIPFINAFCDMIDRHYICAFGRLMNAVVLTCCLSAGLCAGMFAMNVSMF